MLHLTEIYYFYIDCYNKEERIKECRKILNELHISYETKVYHTKYEDKDISKFYFICDATDFQFETLKDRLNKSQYTYHITLKHWTSRPFAQY